MNRLEHITEAVIAININQTYRFGLSTTDLYDFTRGIWRLNKARAENAKYAFSVYQGEIKEVYEIKNWYDAGSTEYRTRQFGFDETKDRYEFVGQIASESVREKYVGKIMPKAHRQNPINYYNC